MVRARNQRRAVARTADPARRSAGSGCGHTSDRGADGCERGHGGGHAASRGRWHERSEGADGRGSGNPRGLPRATPAQRGCRAGGQEANVLRYIDWSLAGDLSAFHPPYSAALAALEVFSSQVYGAAFTALSPAQQDALIARMATGTEKPPAGTALFTGFSPNSAAVFTMIRTHALQGMFGDPMHGGNVGLVGWSSCASWARG